MDKENIRLIGKESGLEKVLCQGATFAKQTETSLPSYRPNVLTTSNKLDCFARPADGGNGARNDETPLVPRYLSAIVPSKKAAFTLAEVLITLGIIGVVSTLTLPTVMKNTHDKEYSVARKRALETIGEAVRLVSMNGKMRAADDAEDFVENYLKKQLHIVKTCDNDNLRNCGIETKANKIYSLKGKKSTMPKTLGELSSSMGAGVVTDAASKSYGFLMSNGFAVNLFYNPNCLGDNQNAQHRAQDKVCVNAVYDMNGLREPNQLGKDIGTVTILYFGMQSEAVAPDIYEEYTFGVKFDEAAAACSNLGKDLTPPTRDELVAMYYNKDLYDLGNQNFWASSPYLPDSTHAWRLIFGDGYLTPASKIESNSVYCVRR